MKRRRVKAHEKDGTRGKEHKVKGRKGRLEIEVSKKRQPSVYFVHVCESVCVFACSSREREWVEADDMQCAVEAGR